jgi:hypothetical protein
MKLLYQEVEVKDFAIALCRFAPKCGFYNSLKEGLSKAIDERLDQHGEYEAPAALHAAFMRRVPKYGPRL